MSGLGRAAAGEVRARGVLTETSSLFMLALDHRRSLGPLFDISDEPGPRDTTRIGEAKGVIFDGLLAASARLGEGEIPGLLVDEQFGAQVLAGARTEPVVAAVACERSGQSEFQFEYGDDFGAHIERIDPELVKALVRFNPGGDAAVNDRQIRRLKRLSDWLGVRDRSLLLELLVPPEAHQLEAVENDRDRFDVELRPELVCQAVTELQDAGIDAAMWKIEGLEEPSDCERVADTCRRRGRDGVGCLILGRGADESRVEHWLRVAAPVDGFQGFAVGRTIWWDAIAELLAGEVAREGAIATIADRYLHFVGVYREAEGRVR